MLQPLESVVMVIADISGYTSYLAGVELDHAQDILADLMTTVVGALRPPFRLAKLEGDAAFVVVAPEKIDGSLLLDTVDATYFAFRRRLRNIRQATRCECNACAALPRLDLKFVVHGGKVAQQRVAGRPYAPVHGLMPHPRQRLRNGPKNDGGFCDQNITNGRFRPETDTAVSPSC